MDNEKASSKYNPTEAARRLLSVMSASDRETLFLKWSEKGFISNGKSQESNPRNQPAMNQPTSSASIPSTSSSQVFVIERNHLNPSNILEHGDVETTMPNEVGSEDAVNEDTSFLNDSDIEVICSQVNITQNTASAQQKDITESIDFVVLDDDVPENKSVKSKQMICYRCPSIEIGTFTNVEKFQLHVKRHITQELFRCVTCERPFTSITKCVAHEIAVHDTKIPSRLLNSRDPVLIRAKNYAIERETRLEEGKDSVSCVDGGEKGDESFDDNPIQGSTCVSMYRGPPVSHQLQQYEIWVNHARPKFQSGIKTSCAHKALAKHQNAVEEGKATNELGNFSKTKDQRYHYRDEESRKRGNSRKRGQKLRKPPSAQRNAKI
ncbi:unnamed protein product [Orchesella dallaii]|uniref:C2H2-type domain-containing protein n=1 Tax=Orchesella dallaii TaxID=48710 RepID=A0ABP1RUI6_9HEXA